MSRSVEERLYNLLPAIYRVRDVEQNESLRALMAVLESQADLIQQDIEGLYDDLFIETSTEWVVPYIGDLLGVCSLYSLEGADVISRRAYIANTIRYRRRKGTAPILEQLARDVTGWPARAVEFFERLSATQHMNHVRTHSLAISDLRHTNQLELLGGPFGTDTRTAEVRRISSGRGKYNIPNIGLFLWRLRSYAITRSTPRPVSEPDDGRYRFSPLGNDIQLFNRPQTETEITHLATETNVPGVLRRRALYDDLEIYRQALVSGAGTPVTRYFGEQPVLQVFFNGDTAALPPEEIVIADLSDWHVAGWQSPDSQAFSMPEPDLTTFVTKVAVDPELGRLAVLKGVALPDHLQVSYAYGFSADIGGGPYSRRWTLARVSSQETWTVTVGQHIPEANYATLGDALAAWADPDTDKDGIITISDSGTYAEALSISMSGKKTLTIQASEGQRPTLRLFDGPNDLADLVVTGGNDVDTSLTLNGLLVEGGLRVDADSLDTLRLLHCTLVPGRGLDAEGSPKRAGRPSIMAELPNTGLKVIISHSIVGPVRLSEKIAGLTVRDSIIHSPLRDGPARHSPALVSGNLKPFSSLSSPTPTIRIQIGDEGPYTASLATKPGTLGQARQLLQASIRTAHDSLAFAGARVVTASNRLIILPGTPAAVSITAIEGDSTSDELRLTDGSERLVQAIVSSRLLPFPILASPTPALCVTMDDEGPYPLTLTPVPASVTQARTQLHNAIRAAHTTPAFQNTIVATGDGQLIVLSGTEDTVVMFGATNDDSMTFRQLGLHEDRPAIGASDIDQRPGPKTSLERVTVFGSTWVRELDMASETVFTGRVTAQRRQIGCTRFSFVPEGSQVPRRHRCQPNLALADYAKRTSKTTDEPTEAQRTAVLAHLTPTFTSENYSEHAYAQLSRTCVQEIRAGAEDGSEMGVFSHLKQPQRETNLRASLEEYLRLGLEAGIFYVT